MFTYFLVTAGVAFDVIQEPPAMGAVNDPITGACVTDPARRSCIQFQASNVTIGDCHS